MPAYFRHYHFIWSTWHVMLSRVLIHMKFQESETIISWCVQWRTPDLGTNIYNWQKLLKKFLPVRPEKMMRRKSSKKTHFDHIAKVWVLSNEVEDTLLQQLLLFVWLYFSGIVWVDKLYKSVKGIYFNVYQRNKRKALSHWKAL